MNATDDWFETEHIGPHAYQITEGQGVLPCHSYLVGDGDAWVLIDAGLGIGDLRTHVESIVGTTPSLVLTHGHWDHIGSAHQFADVKISEREQENGIITPDPVTSAGVDLSASFLEQWSADGRQVPDAFDPGDYEIAAVEAEDVLTDGDVISAGSKRLEIVPIPGHSPGQLAFLDRDGGICYGGDLISPGNSILAPFPDADLRSYLESVRRLRELHMDGAFDTLVTGHAEPMTGPELRILEHLEDALSAVIAGTASYTEESGMWGNVRRYSVGTIDIVASE